MSKKLSVIFMLALFLIGAMSTTGLSQPLPPAWDVNTSYNTGDLVTYKGNVYEMINIAYQGQGDPNWNPEDAIS